VPPLAGKSDKIFVTAIVAPDAGETILQTTTIEIAEDGLPDFRSQTPETGLIPLFMYELQLLEIILDAAVIVR